MSKQSSSTKPHKLKPSRERSRVLKKVDPSTPWILNHSDNLGRRLFQLDCKMLWDGQVEKPTEIPPDKIKLALRLEGVEFRTLTRWRAPAGMSCGPDPRAFIELGESWLKCGGEPDKFIHLAVSRFPGMVDMREQIEQWVPMEKWPGYFKRRGEPDPKIDPAIRMGNGAAPASKTSHHHEQAKRMTKALGVPITKQHVKNASRVKGQKGLARLSDELIRIRLKNARTIKAALAKKNLDS